MYFSKVKQFIGHISRIGDPSYVKRKGWASVGYWMNYLSSTFDLTHDFDSGFKAKFRNSAISGIVSKSIKCWADYMHLPFDMTHDFDLKISKSKFEIA